MHAPYGDIDTETFVAALRSLEPQYEWLGYINSGTYGCVYAGRDRLSLSLVAAKLIRGSSNFTMCHALRELRASLCADHDSIVKPSHVYVLSDATVVFVMTLYDGTLRDVIGKREMYKPRFSIQEVKWVFRSIALAIKEAHAHGFAHRDIKPENVLVRGSCIALGDWGLGRDHLYLRARAKALTPNVVSTWYAPPEVLSESNEYSDSIDIWSLGMLLLELLASQRFSRTTRRETFFQDTVVRLLGSATSNTRKKHLRTTIGRPVDKAVIDLLHDMLSYDPKLRPSISDVCEHPFVKSECVPVSFSNGTERVTRNRFAPIGEYMMCDAGKLVASITPTTIPTPINDIRFPRDGPFTVHDLTTIWNIVRSFRQSHECWLIVLAATYVLMPQFPLWPNVVSSVETLAIMYLLVTHSVTTNGRVHTSDTFEPCRRFTQQQCMKYEANVLQRLHGAVPQLPTWAHDLSPDRSDLICTALCFTDIDLTNADITAPGVDLYDRVVEQCVKHNVTPPLAPPLPEVGELSG